MAVTWIIAKGIGFSPGSVKYIPTHGFLSATPPVVTSASPSFWFFRALRRHLNAA